MSSYYTIVSNQATISYSGGTSSNGGSQSESNIVNTLVYKPILIIYTPEADVCQNCCCYYYCNRICIYNYSLNFLEDVYIRIVLPPYLKYVCGTLDADVCHSKNENIMQIYIKKINPMQLVWIKFESSGYGAPIKQCEELFRGVVTYYIESNCKKIYFAKDFCARYGIHDNDQYRFLQPYL